MNVWLDPCACMMEGKQVTLVLRHEVLHSGDIETPFAPFRFETDGWDGDGAPIPSNFPLK